MLIFVYIVTNDLVDLDSSGWGHAFDLMLRFLEQRVWGYDQAAYFILRLELVRVVHSLMIFIGGSESLLRLILLMF